MGRFWSKSIFLIGWLGLPSLPSSAGNDLGWVLSVDQCTEIPLAMGSQGTVYASSTEGDLLAIHPTGYLKWKLTTEGFLLPPVVGNDDTLYITANHFYALRDEGNHASILWSKPTSVPLATLPAIAEDGTVYLSLGGSLFSALNPEDGSPRWEIELSAPPTSSPLIGSRGTIYLITNDRKLQAITDLGSNADIRFQFELPEACFQEPAIASGLAEDILIVSTPSGRILAISHNGTLRWDFDSKLMPISSVTAPVVGARGVIYLGVDDHLLAISSKGRELFRRWVEGPISEAPVLTQSGQVVVSSSVLTAFDLFGNLLWKHDLSPSACGVTAPTILPCGNLVFGTERIYTLSAKAILANTPWPKFRGNLQNSGRRLKKDFLADSR